MPDSRAWAMKRSTTPASLTPSAEVGSSRMTTLAPKWIGARDGDRLPLAARERADRLRRVAQVDAHPLQLLAGHPIRGMPVVHADRAEPRRRLDAEEEVPADAHERDHRQVLVDGGDPGLERVARRAEVDLLAIHEHLPASGRWTPDSVLMSVDLPAPLSPRRHSTSPALTYIDTSWSAMTLPKYFVRPRASMSGVAPV